METKDEPEIVPGLRIMKPSDSKDPDAAGSNPKFTVGDGGLSWRMKALARAKAQAAQQGGSLSSVVSDRWGSLSELTRSLTEGTAATGNAHLHAAKQRQRDSSGRSGNGPSSARPHYLEDVRSDRNRSSMQRPSDSLSWRGDRGRRQGDDEHRSRRDQEAGPAPSRSGRDEQQRALQGVSQHLNAFSNDGSFMQQFQQSASQQARGEGRPPARQEGAGPREHERPPARAGDPAAAAGDRQRSPGASREPSRRPHDEARDPERASAPRDRRRASEDEPPSAARASDRPAAAAAVAAAAAPQDRPGPREPAEAAAPPRKPGGNQSVAEMLRAKLQGRPLEEPRAPPEAAARPPPAAAPAAPREAAPAGKPPGGNQSAAEMLRAKLKGRGDGGALPPPSRAAPEAAARAPAGQPPSPRGGAPASSRRREAKEYSDSSGGEDDEGRIRGRRRRRPRGSDDDDDDDGGGGGGRGGGSSGSSGDDGRGGGRRRRGAREAVDLPMVDHHGRATKGAFGRDGAAEGGRPDDGRRPKRLVQRYDESGQRQRYFADDDSTDLQTLVKRAKYGDDAFDLDRAAADNIARKARFKTAELDADAEYDYDGGVELYDGRQGRGTREQQQKRERSAQISQFVKANKLQDRCGLCLSSGAAQAAGHLVVSVAQTAYLTLPSSGCLAEGHCCIATSDHVSCMRSADDHAWTEVKNFTKCLIQMFASRGQQCIFLETALDVRGMKAHAALECVPVSQKELDRAPAYFKKAMQEAESEWSVHHAKAVIETTAKKGLRESVPVGFPYLYVQFGYGAGMLHVIDDEQNFDRHLGRQVLAGLLKLPAEDMYRNKGKAGTTAKQAADFRAAWKPFDWTAALG